MDVATNANTNPRMPNTRSLECLMAAHVESGEDQQEGDGADEAANDRERTSHRRFDRCAMSRGVALTGTNYRHTPHLCE